MIDWTVFQPMSWSNVDWPELLELKFRGVADSKTCQSKRSLDQLFHHEKLPCEPSPSQSAASAGVAVARSNSVSIPARLRRERGNARDRLAFMAVGSVGMENGTHASPRPGRARAWRDTCMSFLPFWPSGGATQRKSATSQQKKFEAGVHRVVEPPARQERASVGAAFPQRAGGGRPRGAGGGRLHRPQSGAKTNWMPIYQILLAGWSGAG